MENREKINKPSRNDWLVVCGGIIMIDLYADEVHLTDIQRKDKEVLVFKNKGKDESVIIPVSNEELVNIYQRVKMRCETLNLIPIINN